MLSVVILSVIMLSVVMLNVVAPAKMSALFIYFVQWKKVLYDHLELRAQSYEDTQTTSAVGWVSWSVLAHVIRFFSMKRASLLPLSDLA